MSFIPSTEGMVLVMGVTGAGKSFFVNKLKEGSVLEGASLGSTTDVCQIVATSIGDTKVAVVDCPGFDDSKHRTDVEILSMISEIVTTQCQTGIKLWGVIFLHRITDIKYQGSAQEVLAMFRQLLGDDALPNVVLVTTQWSRLTGDDQKAAIAREQELRDQYWREMLDKKSMMTRFDDTKNSAEAITALLVGRSHVILQLQKEVVHEKKTLRETTVGSVLTPKVTRKLRAAESDVKRLHAELQRNPTNTRRLRIERELAEVEAIKARSESDTQQLNRRIGAELTDKLKRINWAKGLKIIFSVATFTISVVTMAVGGPGVSFG